LLVACLLSLQQSAIDVNVQVNPSFVAELESHGMTFVGQDIDAQRMEIMELQGWHVALFNFR